MITLILSKHDSIMVREMTFQRFIEPLADNIFCVGFQKTSLRS